MAEEGSARDPVVSGSALFTRDGVGLEPPGVLYTMRTMRGFRLPLISRRGFFAGPGLGLLVVGEPRLCFLSFLGGRRFTRELG